MKLKSWPNILEPYSMKHFLLIIFLINASIACSQSEETEIWQPVPKTVYSKTDSTPPSMLLFYLTVLIFQIGKLGEVKSLNGL